MVLDGEEPVWHRDEHLVGHAHQFAHEALLLADAADVLQHRVGNGVPEGPVGERQRSARRDAHVLDARESPAEVLPLAEAGRDDRLRVGVTPLQHVRRAGHHVGNADIQDAVARRRCATLHECSVDLVPRGNRHPVP